VCVSSSSSPMMMTTDPACLLPAPIHVGKYLREKRVDFRLPYDIWWLHSSGAVRTTDLALFLSQLLHTLSLYYIFFVPFKTFLLYMCFYIICYLFMLYLYYLLFFKNTSHFISYRCFIKHYVGLLFHLVVLISVVSAYCVEFVVPARF